MWCRLDHVPRNAAVRARCARSPGTDAVARLLPGARESGICQHVRW